jgi:predicted transcriptional regulator of viral defense system
MPQACPVTPAQRDRRDTEVIAALATRQDGVVSRAQLGSLGLSRSSISRWVAAGRLYRIHPGVYSVGHAALSLEARLRAAHLYGGGRAVFSHTTAAWLWRLIDAEPKRIHLTVPGRRSSLPGVRIHRSRQVDATEHLGHRLTSVARTLVDLAAMLSYHDLRRALAEADYRGLFSVHEIRSALKPGLEGSRAVRRAIDQYLPELARTLSALEDRFLELCQTAGLPMPEVNAVLGGHEGRCPLARAGPRRRTRRCRRPRRLGPGEQRPRT